jgi:tRNA (adenine57-N1/adenine58-N1)-methyltransferase
VNALTERVKKNEMVVLIDDSEKRYFVNTSGKTDKIKGIGVFDPAILIEKRIGSKIEIGSKTFFIFHPSLDDKLMGLKRKAQIILPRDVAQIVVNCSIESGHTVLESGIGSGSLTIGLANAVAPDGKVISYDNREDFIKHALKNLKQAGFDKLVSTKNKDITKKIDETELDAVILDIPNPWDAIGHAYHALKSGGYLCCYSPLISQVEKTVDEIKKHGFILVKTTENIQREMVVSKHGTRPSFNMLGHTGYLTFARKVLL